MSSTFGGQHPPLRQGSGGALTGRAARPRSGPRRAPGTLERSGKVYGATPSMLKVHAEAPHQGAGSQMRRGMNLQHGRPHGSAAGGIAQHIVNRRWDARSDHRRWSR